MIVRRACDSDIAAVLRMARALWSEAPSFKGVEFDAYRVNAVADKLVKAGTLLVAEITDVGAVGFMAYMVLTDTWANRKVATEVALYVMPEARGEGIAGRLLAAALAGATEAGAVEFSSGTSLGLPAGAAESVYDRAGFTVTGWTFRKPLAARVAVA